MVALMIFRVLAMIRDKGFVHHPRRAGDACHKDLDRRGAFNSLELMNEHVPYTVGSTKVISIADKAIDCI